MNTGTLIRTKSNVHNYPERDGDKFMYRYYILREGAFEISDEEYGYTWKFVGQHFICLGDEYFGGTEGHIVGFELLDEEHEIVDSVSHKLKP